MDDDGHAVKLRQQERIVYVGTKRGKLKQVSWIDGCLMETMSVSDVNIIMTSSNERDVGVDREEFVFKPYPLYSMVHMTHQMSDVGCDDCETLLCGGADRFVTVLEKDRLDSSHDCWIMVQRLGPHTGWIKDLVQCQIEGEGLSSDLLLFSIGCNCIEVWKMEINSQTRSTFSHWKKLKIESSVTMGCTLSSDLLCLGIYKGQYLFAAGVDGRVHGWDVDQSFEKVGVMAAHDGRVNAMVVCELLNMLVTTGNDGKVLCLEMIKSQSSQSMQCQGSWRAYCGLDLCEVFGSRVKVTSLAMIHEKPFEALVSIGTANGLVLIARICHASNNSNDIKDKCNISLLGDCFLNVGADCTVYALQSLHEGIPCLEGTKYCLAVGYQEGMQVWEFVLK